MRKEKYVYNEYTMNIPLNLVLYHAKKQGVA